MMPVVGYLIIFCSLFALSMNVYGFPSIFFDTVGLATGRASGL